MSGDTFLMDNGEKMNSGSAMGTGKIVNARFLGWLVFTVVALDCLVALSVWQGLQVMRDRAIEYAEQETRNLAEAVSNSLTHSVEKIDGSLLTVGNELEDQLRKGPIDQARLLRLLRQQREINHATRTWSIVNERGEMWLMDGSMKPVNVAGREYFQLGASGRQSGLIMSQPLVSPQDAAPLIVFARSFHHPDGSFGGMVVAPVDQEFFAHKIENFSVRSHGLITLRGADLSLVARHASSESKVRDPIGSKANVSDIYRRLVASGITQATYHTAWPGDMVSRIFSFRRLRVVPVFVVVGVADADYLVGWARARHVAMIYVGLFWVLSALIAYILHRSWTRQYRYASSLRMANDQLNDSNDAMRTLLQVGEQGLCSLDFITRRWDCSPEQAAIFGIGREHPRTQEGWLQLVHEDDQEHCRRQLAKAAERGVDAIDMEYRIVRPCDQSICCVHMVARLEYLENGELARLFGAIRDITALRESEKRIQHLAYHDDLTGLPNRVLLAEHVQQAQAQALRRKEMLAICFLDLDGFKAINDEWGHDVGNQVLVEVSRRLTACVRTGDTVSRLGGDEFVILLGSLREENEFRNVLERLRQAVAMTIQVAGVSVSVTISAGVTIFPRDSAVEADVLIRHADNAMYEAKRGGKNRVHMFDPEGDRNLRESQAQYARITEALYANEFVLHYQPKVDLHSDRVVGVEALIRWQNPERGMLAPGMFLPVVEHTEMAIELGEWVMREALRQKREWQAAGLDLAVSVNVFAQHLQHPQFVQRLAAILEEFPDVEPSGLELEILETSLIKDLQEISHRMVDSVALGVSFSLDDFGTGYSSLSYFRKFPVRVVKIDQSFVRGILEDAEDQALVTSIVDMAHGLQRRVVAEGVETLQHGLPLLFCGCDYAQGFGIARPMPADAVVEWVSGWQRPQMWAAASMAMQSERLLPPEQQLRAAGTQRG
jgi:diguanylate cyclase (GGDEF)-like protein